MCEEYNAAEERASDCLRPFSLAALVESGPKMIGQQNLHEETSQLLWQAALSADADVRVPSVVPLSGLVAFSFKWAFCYWAGAGTGAEAALKYVGT